MNKPYDPLFHLYMFHSKSERKVLRVDFRELITIDPTILTFLKTPFIDNYKLFNQVWMKNHEL